MTSVESIELLRSTTLRSYILSSDDLKRRKDDQTAYIRTWCLFFAFVPFVRYGMDRLTHDKADIGKAFAMFLTYAVVGSVWYVWRRLRFNQELEDKIIVEDDQIVLVRDISSVKIMFKKIADVSTCTDGLWVEHGWSYTILDSKYFESYTDMLKFKDALLAVAKEARKRM